MKLYITLEDLNTLGACRTQQMLFYYMYGPRPVEITEEACLKVAAVFDWDWIAFKLLEKEDAKFYKTTVTHEMHTHEAFSGTSSHDCVEPEIIAYQIKAKAFAQAVLRTNVVRLFRDYGYDTTLAVST